MAILKYHITGITLVIVFLFFARQPVLGAKDLDDDPIIHGNSSQDGVMDSWSYGLLERWPGAPYPIMLKYGFEQNIKPIDWESVAIDYLSQRAIKDAFARAFATWSSVIQVTFQEVDYNLSKPDIRIRFFHFDRWMTDDLIHVAPPLLGGLRLNADVNWAVEVNSENSKDAFNLESVAIHAIGHVLGLGHAYSEEAIMYKQMSAGVKKVDFPLEDVAGAQQLYGPNPKYH